MSNRKSRLAIFTVAVAVLIATPLALWASDAFNDVPDSNVHHDDITWLKDNGVTAGCNPPANTEFCPGDSVLRQQMASFMRRLAENEVVNAATAVEADHAATADDSDTVDGMDSAALLGSAAGRSIADESSEPIVSVPDYAEITDVQLTLPHDGGVLLTYSVSARSSGTPVAFRIGVSEGPDCSSVDMNTHVYGSVAASATSYDSAAGSVVVAVPAGSHTFTLCAQTDSAVPVNADGASITAISVGEAQELSVLSTSATPTMTEGFGK